MRAGPVLERRLPPLAPSVGEARRLLRCALRGVDHETWLDDAQLALSEVVTNALVHAGTDIDVRVYVAPSRMRVEVRDGSTHLPKVAGFGSGAGTGRGLTMLAGFTDAWGIEPEPSGKTVWFELVGDLDADADRAAIDPDPDVDPALGADVADPDADPDRAAAEVALLGVPLLTHAAWQEHAASVLRELLLVRLDADVHAIEAHAAASAAMALLAEQLPPPVLEDDPEAIMASAVEPVVTADDVRLRVPLAAVADFAVLDALLDDAEALDAGGGLLTAPLQPEVREFRRWLCREVRTQAPAAGGGRPAGTAAPRRWEVADDWSPPSTPAAAPDTSAVSRSTSALVAADETNRILAVSPAAASLLGYPDADELVGHRLLALIPPRLHQAHLAGFTLHLVNGRSPLLGTRVEVPVVLADGTEQLLGLRVDTWPAPHGRRLYVAELDGATPAGTAPTVVDD